MKNKIIGIFICMLLVVVTIYPVASVKNNDENIIEDKTIVETEEKFDSTSFEEDEWPTHHHDLQSTGYSTSSYAPQTNNVLFIFDIGGDDWFSYSPSIANGRVYIPSGFNLNCVNATTGDTIWQYFIHDTGISYPAIYNDKVYFGRMWYWRDYYCNIICLNETTGKKVWESDRLMGKIYHVDAPVVANGKLYCSVGYNNNTLLCLDAENGTILWNVSMDEFDPIADESLQIPAIFNGKIYFGGGRKMGCFNAESGEGFWNFTTEDEYYVSTPPAISDGKVYFGTSYKNIYPSNHGEGILHCIDADTGTEIWNFEAGHIVACPAIAYGCIYFHDGYGYFYCLDKDTGVELWKYEMIGNYGQHSTSTPAVADWKVYVGVFQFGDILCLDAETGEKIWSYNLDWHIPNYFHSSPAVAYDTLFIGAGGWTSQMYAFKDYSYPPDIPILEGPTQGFQGEKNNFTIQTIDPEGDDVSYYVDWGDGNTSEWIGPFPSGESVNISYTWSEKGVYQIKVRAQDKYNIKSRWSELHNIDIKAGPLQIMSIYGRLFKVRSDIENTVDYEINNVNWRITIKGGVILLGRVTKGNIDNVSIGEISTVTSSLIIGFGKVIIEVVVEIPDKGFNTSEERKAYVFLTLII